MVCLNLNTVGNPSPLRLSATSDATSRTGGCSFSGERHDAICFGRTARLVLSDEYRSGGCLVLQRRDPVTEGNVSLAAPAPLAVDRR